MLENKIINKRKELDESIENNEKYENIYRLSVELDDLITEFYKDSKEIDKKRTRKFFRKHKELKKILYIA